jgi:hypothetical protein
MPLTRFFLAAANNGINNPLNSEMKFDGTGKFLQHFLPGGPAINLGQPGVQFISRSYRTQHAVVKLFQKFTVSFVSHDVSLALPKTQVEPVMRNDDARIVEVIRIREMINA